MTDLYLSSQVWFVVLAGAGMGLMLGQAETDVVYRASRTTYGEATGITQTVRNFAASLGFAILGTIAASVFRSRLTTSLTSKGLPGGRLPPRRRRSHSPKAGTEALSHFRTSSASTLPTRRGLSSSSWRVSWRSGRLLRDVDSRQESRRGS